MMFCQKYKYYIRTNDLMLTFCGRDTESEARQTEKQHTNKSKSVKCLWREFDLDFFPKWTEKQGQKANKHKIDIKKNSGTLKGSSVCPSKALVRKLEAGNQPAL